MPIYRGATRVTPRRAGVDLARVYRGSQLCWQAGPVLALDWTLSPTAISGYSYPPTVLFTEPEGPGSVYEVSASLEHANSRTAQYLRYQRRIAGGTLSNPPVFGVTSMVSGQVYTAQITLEPGLQVTHQASINGPGDDVISGWATMRRLGDPT